MQNRKDDFEDFDFGDDFSDSNGKKPPSKKQKTPAESKFSKAQK